jgi:[ribosomal protein S18]-alanine N-acetyltransferase
VSDAGREALVAIGDARPTDAAACAAIDAATSTSPWPEATFASELARADRAYVVARSAADGEVVGYAGLAMLAGDGHVLGLAVRPGEQGRGLGARLLDALLGRAAAAEVAGVTLEVRPSNRAALRLYRRVGFVAEGRRPRYYPDGEDALIMWLTDPAAAASGAAPAPHGSVTVRPEGR